MLCYVSDTIPWVYRSKHLYTKLEFQPDQRKKFNRVEGCFVAIGWLVPVVGLVAAGYQGDSHRFWEPVG